MPDEKRNSTYHSAVDWWIAALLMMGPIICVILTGMLIWEGRQQDALYCLITSAGVLMVTAIFTVPCRYTLRTDTLAIRCGLIAMHVPLEQIKSIEKSGSWLSGPALSIKRVKISTASRFYLVSPKNRDRFIEELSAAVAAISNENDSKVGAAEKE